MLSLMRYVVDVGIYPGEKEKKLFQQSACRRPSHPSRSVIMAVSSLSHILRERSVRTLLLKNDGVILLEPLLKLPSGKTFGLDISLGLPLTALKSSPWLPFANPMTVGQSGNIERTSARQAAF